MNEGTNAGALRFGTNALAFKLSFLRFSPMLILTLYVFDSNRFNGRSSKVTGKQKLKEKEKKKKRKRKERKSVWSVFSFYVMEGLFGY